MKPLFLPARSPSFTIAGRLHAGMRAMGTAMSLTPLTWAVTLGALILALLGTNAAATVSTFSGFAQEARNKTKPRQAVAVVSAACPGNPDQTRARCGDSGFRREILPAR